MRNRGVILVVLTLPLVAHCVGGDDDVMLDGSADGSSDSTSNKDGVVSSDSNDDTNACVPGCIADASAFHACDGAVDTTCNFGCLESPNAHCGVFNPTGLVEPSDFTLAGLTDFEPCAADAGQGANSCSVVFHTDTGLITDENNTTIRPMNASPTTDEVGNGIGFHVASYDSGTDKLAIFQFKDFYLGGGEIHFTGPNPVAFVAQGDMLIAGLVDTIDNQFFGQCSAAAGGGAAGGASSDAGSPSLGGGGSGSGTTQGAGGGGGGGSATSGGAGGNGGFASYYGGTAGPAFSEGFDPLRGGGGGGGAGLAAEENGAAGGGALALFANGTITIQPGGGTTWGVNASGCGAPPSGGFASNGGAGAGGAILVEAHAVIGFGGAGLAANGGSGGGGGLGSRGTISSTPAQGTAAETCYGTGGNGAAGTTAATAGQTPSSCGTIPYGGGGGGGAGRIEIGSFVPMVVDGGFVISPPATTITTPVE